MSKLAEFAVGMGGGYLKASDQRKENERRDRLEAEQKARQDEFDRRSLEASDLQLGEARAGRDLRLSLADAAKPRTVEDVQPAVEDIGTMGPPTSTQPLSLGQARIGNRYFGSKEDAEKAALLENKPDAVMGRQSLAYAQAGRPDQAAAVDKQRREYAQWLQNEGVVAAAQAARRGDPRAVFDAFNRQGENKLKEPPQVKEEIREIPGMGKVKSFTYTGTVIAPDGSEQSITKNSHDMLMELMPYKDMLDFGMKGQENVSKQDKRVSDAEAALQRAQAAEDRAKTYQAAAELRAARGSGGGRADPNDRLVASGLMKDTKDTINRLEKQIEELQSKDFTMTKTSEKPQAIKQRDLDVAALKDKLRDAEEEHKVYKGIMLGTSPKAQPSLADANKPAAATPKLAAPKPGAIQGGYRFKGGNPADKANWEPA